MGQQQAVMGLAQFLSATPQYHELKQSTEELKKNPALAQALRDFKAAASNASHSQEQMERVGREYQRLMQIPEFRRYFQAGDKFGEVLNGIISEVHAMLEQALG